MKNSFVIVLIMGMLLVSCNKNGITENFQQQNIEATEENERLLEENNKLLNEIESKIERITGLENDIERLESINKELENENSELKQEIPVLEDDMKQLEDKLSRVMSEKANLEESIATFSLEERFRGIMLFMKYEEAINILGKPNQIEVEDTIEVGELKTLIYDDFSVFFAYDQIRGITIDTPGVEVIRGIKVGDAVDKIGFSFSISDVYFDENNNRYVVQVCPEWGYWLSFTVNEGTIVRISFGSLLT